MNDRHQPISATVFAALILLKESNPFYCRAPLTISGLRWGLLFQFDRYVFIFLSSISIYSNHIFGMYFGAKITFFGAKLQKIFELSAQFKLKKCKNSYFFEPILLKWQRNRKKVTVVAEMSPFYINLNNRIFFVRFIFSRPYATLAQVLGFSCTTSKS